MHFIQPAGPDSHNPNVSSPRHPNLPFHPTFLLPGGAAAPTTLPPYHPNWEADSAEPC
ncbi:hypothetical protein CPB83DRAFT_845717 [Crepidotus variabilis]|uniref:Uncharacterized protein n=1 Tax=Crepidotus variabilis TaxID=179855 RepID=A0A9P6EQG3_9AGAR|nr:hypothetical protein CPB83DRAFT_856275 [Crepidotus variabilis]KAF9533038.1 hypothetical protein CPB83DRAFT_845717 [Crepidotus variabilis]